MTQAPIHSIPTTGSAQWQAKAELFDYRQAANPVRAGLTEPIPLRQWDPALHQSGPTAVVPLDLSNELGCSAPATSPGLSANFCASNLVKASRQRRTPPACCFMCCTDRAASSVLARRSLTGALEIFLYCRLASPLLTAKATSVLYWVHDGPLLSHLGVEASTARFEPTHYPAALLQRELDQLLADPSSARSNRLSLLLANSDLPQSRTVTHTLWAMLGVVPAGAIQPPHRHQSVALDLIIDCDPGCYTLVGTELDASGAIANPSRIDWQSGGAFITPPGYWHAHVNSSERMSRLLPIQDSGLHTYLRSLDIRFSGGLQGNG